jgi:kinesin family protein 5
MEGLDIFDNTLKGLIPRLINHLFNEIRKMSEYEVTIKVSMVEIYNEKVRDLLDLEKINLEIYEDNKNGVLIKDVTTI